MIRIGQVVVAILFLSSGNNAMAGALTYTCEVAHVYSLSDKGSLEISALEKDMKGSSFSVSRATGEIIGEVVPTLMAKSSEGPSGRGNGIVLRRGHSLMRRLRTKGSPSAFHPLVFVPVQISPKRPVANPEQSGCLFLCQFMCSLHRLKFSLTGKILYC